MSTIATSNLKTSIDSTIESIEQLVEKKSVMGASSSIDGWIKTLGKIKRTYKNRCGSRRIFILNNYNGYLILSPFTCLK
jgi:hypothetical protein